MKFLIVCTIIVIALAGCTVQSASTPPDPTSETTKMILDIIVQDIPGYGRCTFAFTYIDGGYDGGPALTLVGCNGQLA